MTKTVFLSIVIFILLVGKDFLKPLEEKSTRLFNMEVVFESDDKSTVDAHVKLYSISRNVFYSTRRFMIQVTKYPENSHETWEGNWSRKDKIYLLEFDSALPSEVVSLLSRKYEINSALIVKDSIVTIPKSAKGLWIYEVYCSRTSKKLRTKKGRN